MGDMAEQRAQMASVVTKAEDRTFLEQQINEINASKRLQK